MNPLRLAAADLVHFLALASAECVDLAVSGIADSYPAEGLSGYAFRSGITDTSFTDHKQTT